MSGFLQRMAAGVLQPRRSIHPSVGPMWAGVTKIEPLAEVPAQPALRSTDALETREMPPPARTETEHYGTSAEGEVSRKTVQPRPEAVPFQPLVETSAAREAFPAAPQAPFADAIAARTEGLEAVRPEGAAGEDSDATRQHGQASSRLLVPTTQIAGTREGSPFGLSTPRPAQQPSATITPEPDTIEIHIGRIEVLAAPPRPSQPAAPRPARKSLDLGAYLRRERRPR